MLELNSKMSHGFISLIQHSEFKLGQVRLNESGLDCVVVKITEKLKKKKKD